MKANHFSLTSACLLILMVCISCIPLESPPTATEQNQATTLTPSTTPTLFLPSVTLPPTKTSVPKHTPVVTQTSTTAPTTDIDLSELPPGDYLVYATDWIRNKIYGTSVHLSNLDRSFQLDLGNNGSDIPFALISPDNHLWIYWIKPEVDRLRLENAMGRETASVNGDFECNVWPYPLFTLSPDGKLLAYGCFGHLLVLSLTDDSILCDIELPESIHHGDQRILESISVGEVAWSPNSDWIAFSWQSENVGSSDPNDDHISGIYLTGTLDTDQGFECSNPQKITRYLGSSVIAWTSSNLLAIKDDYTDNLELYDPSTKQLVFTISSPTSDTNSMEYPVLSPDGTRLAYSVNTDIHILSIEDGKDEDWNIDGIPLLWITVPPR